MPLTNQGGSLVLKSNALGTGQDCCCEPCVVSTVCILQQSGEVSGIPGSDVVFSGGGGTYATLSFDGVFGYWLGRYETTPITEPGYTQSVTITFTTKKPFRVVVLCSAIDEQQGDEKLNYSFSGADSVVFAVELGSGFVDDGQTVTRPGQTGSSRCSITAEGEISEVFIEGEMIDNGSNGIVVSVCADFCE